MTDDERRAERRGAEKLMEAMKAGVVNPPYYDWVQSKIDELFPPPEPLLVWVTVGGFEYTRRDDGTWVRHRPDIVGGVEACGYTDENVRALASLLPDAAPTPTAWLTVHRRTRMLGVRSPTLETAERWIGREVDLWSIIPIIELPEVRSDA